MLETPNMEFDPARQSKVGRALWQRYGTEAKEANARRLHQAMAWGEDRVDAYPWRVVVETGNICNLRCCTDRTSRWGMARGFLTLGDAQRFLEPLWPWLVQVNLFNWGEPLLNRDLPEIIRLIHDHHVGTQIHTNMNYLPDDLGERIIEAGLDFLVASIDGVTQPVYETYRKGGSCEQALANLKKLVEMRNAKNTDTPRIIWRFLCFPHNRHEIEAAHRLAEEIGVDDLALGEGGLDGYTYTRHDRKKIGEQTQSPQPPYCRDVYDFPVIHWDGTLLPCCNIGSIEFAWGDLKTCAFLDAFNGPQFRAARRLVSGDPAAKSPCQACPRIPQPVDNVV